MAKDGWKQELQTHRDAIDALDEKLVALLKERLSYVKAVGVLKQKHEAEIPCLIRPAREAKMVRRIIDRFKDTSFPVAAAASLWRTIIGASTHTESPLSISVFSPNDYAPLFWLTREYFGSCVNIIRQPTAKRVVGDVMDGKAQVGVLPLPGAEEQDQWWTHIAYPGKDMPRIFAYVPFVTGTQAEMDKWGGLAIAKVNAEMSGEDISYLVLKTDMDVSQNRLRTLFQKTGIESTWLSLITVQNQHRLHLIELKGFYETADEKLQSCLSEIGVSMMDNVVIGSYAVPYVITKTQDHSESAAVAKA